MRPHSRDGFYIVLKGAESFVTHRTANQDSVLHPIIPIITELGTI